MNLSEIESVVNAYALDMAKKMKLGLSKDDFQIHFQTSGAFDTQMLGGRTVHIHTKIYPTNPEWNMHLREWLKVVVKLRRPHELVRREDTYQWSHENKKLLKTNGLDSDLIPSLLPKDRLQITILTKVIVRDMVTGEKESIESEKISSDAMIQTARVRLSRRVEEIEKLTDESNEGEENTNV